MQGIDCQKLLKVRSLVDYSLLDQSIRQLMSIIPLPHNDHRGSLGKDAISYFLTVFLVKKTHYSSLFGYSCFNTLGSPVVLNLCNFIF